MLNTTEAARLEKVVGPFLGPIREVILEGFRFRHRAYSEELCNHSPRTRASLTNDHIVEFAKRKLMPMGVKVFNVQNRILFNIRGEVILHFKKLNRKMLASNYPTLFALNFVGQQELPGIPSLLRLVAGFTTRDWIAVDGVYLTLPNGDDGVDWVKPLEEPKQTTITEELIKDEPIQQPRRRVRAKRKRRDKPMEGTGTEGA